jgi:DNA end-binding protein Ku
MKAIWEGSISFGLVSIPVKLFKATKSKKPKFRYLHAKCGTPLTYVRRCPKCNIDVPWEEVIKGYEYEKGKFVMLKEEEIEEELPMEFAHSAAIVDFVEEREVDPIYFDEAYYLVPTKAGLKPYVLLREAMKKRGKGAIVRVGLKTRVRLGFLKARENILVLGLMFYPDEILSPDLFEELKEDISLTPQEEKMAQMLVDNLTASFEPGKYTDEYREALLKKIREKVEKLEGVVEVKEEAQKVVDLMEALKKSLEITKKKAAK